MSNAKILLKVAMAAGYSDLPTIYNMLLNNCSKKLLQSLQYYANYGILVNNNIFLLGSPSLMTDMNFSTLISPLELTAIVMTGKINV